jgi:hypothetical protein
MQFLIQFVSAQSLLLCGWNISESMLYLTEEKSLDIQYGYFGPHCMLTTEYNNFVVIM